VTIYRSALPPPSKKENDYQGKSWCAGVLVCWCAGVLVSDSMQLGNARQYCHSDIIGYIVIH